MPGQLRRLQEIAGRIIAQIDEKLGTKHDNLLTMLHLVEELGEVARELVNMNTGREESRLENLGKELLDVIFLALHLASTYGIDLDEALRSKVEELEGRFGIDLHWVLKELGG